MKKLMMILLLVGCGIACQFKKTSAPSQPISTTAYATAAVQDPSVMTDISSSTPDDSTPRPAQPTVISTGPISKKSGEITSAPQAAIETSVQSPLTDRKQFKEEELISLEGRLLSPLLQNPASTAIQTAPWKNEQLKYGVYYSFVKAGTAYIKNQGLADINGRPTYLIQTSAFSAPVIDTVFRVRDINYSWIDAETFYSKGYSQSLREGNYKRDEWVIFDYDSNKYRGQIKKKGEPRNIQGSLSQQVLDILSALYYVRIHPLEPGKDIVFDIINREEQYPLVVKVLGKETVKTAAGKFKCIVVEPQFRGEGIFVSKGKSLKVWLTDDKYKMPIKMKTEVFIGSVSAELLEYKRN